MKPRKITHLELDEISLVDNPANDGARVTLFKRHAVGIVDAVVKVVTKSYGDPKADFLEALKDAMENEVSWKLGDALMESVRQTMKEFRGDARDIKIRENVEDFLTASRQIFGEDEQAMMNKGMSEDDVRVHLLRTTRKDAGAPGELDTPEGTMDVNELKKELGKLQTQAAGLEQALKDAGVVTTTADDGTVTLDTSGVTKSVQDSVDAITTAVKAAGFVANTTDGKVELTKADDQFVEFRGERVLKSEVPAPLLKAFQEQDAELASLRKAHELEALTKRADAELPNIAGTPEQRGQLLKAVDGIKDAGTRKTVSDALKAADAAVSSLFKSVGSVEEDETSATARLDKLAKAYAEEKGTTYHVAFAEVTKTGEGKKLFAETRTEA